LALDTCVAINVFWKHLDEDNYEKKDLYGNKDLLLGAKALKEVEALCQTLSQLPEYYREFYAKKVISKVENTFE